ncbi:MAG: Lrp/AsnC family transcriptional regulator [Candidatus Dadabacteria bacterium]|nr:MAG: Lrp/AsnC family transcriptional regulator [Candidatus Dadabacteria bacterium]
MTFTEQRIIEELLRGLPLVSRPWQALAQELGLSEAEVAQKAKALLEDGVLRRIGAVVRHHELGYTANGMAVWDIPDEQVAQLGRRLAAEPRVNLCYRRARVEGVWNYNLFAMVHGHSEDDVRRAVADMARRIGLTGFPHALLFSTRRYKQCAGRYVEPSIRERGDHAAA